MLTSINIQLEALNNTDFTTDSALGIHGLFFKILEEIDPLLSEALHNLDQLKPYTISSLREINKEYRTQNVRKGQLYSFRMTILEEKLFNTFHKGLHNYSTNNILLKIGRGDFIIKNYNIEETTTFDRILQTNKMVNRFKLIFKSPTSFRKVGKNYLFPDPEQLFKSYVDKWNTLAPTQYVINDEEKEALQQYCFASQYELKTELTNMSRYKIVGFRGSCNFQLDKETQKDIIVIFNRLLNFIPFCGTGYKTTMGMGQTGVVKTEK